MSDRPQIAAGCVAGALLAATVTAMVAVIPAALRPATPPPMVKIGAALLLGGCDSTYRCCSKAHCEPFGEDRR